MENNTTYKEFSDAVKEYINRIYALPFRYKGKTDLLRQDRRVKRLFIRKKLKKGIFYCKQYIV